MASSLRQRGCCICMSTLASTRRSWNSKMNSLFSFLCNTLVLFRQNDYKKVPSLPLEAQHFSGLKRDKTFHAVLNVNLFMRFGNRQCVLYGLFLYPTRINSDHLLARRLPGAMPFAFSRWEVILP